MRIAAAAVSIFLFLVMVYLFVVGPRLGFTNQPLTVECGSVAEAGWPSDSYVDTEGVRHLVDHIPSGVDDKAMDGIVRDCDQHRTTYTGMMALLAVPTVLAGVLAFWLPRKQKPEPKLRETL